MFTKRFFAMAVVITLVVSFWITTFNVSSQSTACTNVLGTLSVPVHQINDALDDGLTTAEATQVIGSLGAVERAGHEYQAACFEQSFDFMVPTASQVRGLPKPTYQQTANPSQPAFNGCPIQGLASTGTLSADKQDLNRKKNRIDTPQANIYQPISFTAFRNLPWSAPIAHQSALAENFPVVIEGYLGWVASQDGESPNCNQSTRFPDFDCDPLPTSASPANVDFHISLLDYPVVGFDHSSSGFAHSAIGRSRADAIIVETTPRVRINHPGWTIGRLCAFVFDGTRVRISGWSMLDPEHPENVGETRATIWEIHPIMRIEFWDGKTWIELN